ncbi:ATPase, T2SS/T4P/T4SS family [Sanguibacter sp. Z1732]|uniref:ATPase, T2SS/T4P/T4SS family n=1 Tax=Sanguibacter sp. Z1732 TaxID=3435412 RepID=UPI003D9C99CA
MQVRANVMVSGATGAGKTTLLAAMLSLVPATERILCIEEAAELMPDHPHVVHLQVRRSNVQGAGGVGLDQLVRTAMRMRPDRLVLGECRGAEVREVLGALNTGHDGGWATVHANAAGDVPARLVALGSLAGLDPAAVAVQAASALDAIVHLRAVTAGAVTSTRSR